MHDSMLNDQRKEDKGECFNVIIFPDYYYWAQIWTINFNVFIVKWSHCLN